MREYKQYFIDAGFERYYPDTDWYFSTWGGTFVGKPGQQIIDGVVPLDIGMEIQSLAGIRILGLYIRIGSTLTSYRD